MSTALPSHIAVIMDGNGRWAKRQGKPRSAGHKAGVRATRALIEACVARKIPYLTVFAFSSENWRRPKPEVTLLMDLFMRSLREQLADLAAQGIRMRFIGDRSAFSKALQAAMSEAEALTVDNTRLHLQIAVNYGGQWDITQATQRLFTDLQQGVLAIDGVTPELLASYLSTAGLPDPDLFIRTGGEQRISNYLLWQLAYTELYFSPCFWPEFDAQALDDALAFYAGRQRRFGRTGEQVSDSHA